MPIYEYQCDGCGAVFEIFQKMSDPPPGSHGCGSTQVHRLLSNTSFVLKGTGWYKTDYADKPAGRGKSGDKGDSGKADAAGDGDKTDRGDSGKADAKAGADKGDGGKAATSGDGKAEGGGKPAAQGDKAPAPKGGGGGNAAA